MSKSKYFDSLRFNKRGEGDPVTSFCAHLVIYQPRTGASGVVRHRAGGIDRPKRIKSHPAGSLSSPASQACRRVRPVL